MYRNIAKVGSFWENTHIDNYQDPYIYLIHIIGPFRTYLVVHVHSLHVDLVHAVHRRADVIHKLVSQRQQLNFHLLDFLAVLEQRDVGFLECHGFADCEHELVTRKHRWFAGGLRSPTPGWHSSCHTAAQRERQPRWTWSDSVGRVSVVRIQMSQVFLVVFLYKYTTCHPTHHKSTAMSW